MTPASADQRQLLSGTQLLTWHAAVDRYTDLVAVEHRALCLALEAGCGGHREMQRSSRVLHDRLGSTLLELDLLLREIETQLSDPDRPVDEFLERLYRRFGERWATDEPEPTPPPPPCPHPLTVPPMSDRRTLVAGRVAMCRLRAAGVASRGGLRTLRRHPTTALFPDFLRITAGYLETAEGHGRQLGELVDTFDRLLTDTDDVAAVPG